MYKMMIGCGIYFGFRENSEHTNFSRNNLERGFFEEGHPLQGEEFYAVRNMLDKTNKLTASNPVVKSHNSMRIPVLSHFGQFIRRYIAMLSPFQDRMYVLQTCHFFSAQIICKEGVSRCCFLRQYASR